MLYLWKHNVFRVESCSCIEKSGKLDVSREQDVTRTHMVRVVCCLSLTGYQSLQYVSLRLRTFFVSRKRANMAGLGSNSSHKPPLAERVMYEKEGYGSHFNRCSRLYSDLCFP